MIKMFNPWETDARAVQTARGECQRILTVGFRQINDGSVVTARQDNTKEETKNQQRGRNLLETERMTSILWFAGKRLIRTIEPSRWIYHVIFTVRASARLLFSLMRGAAIPSHTGKEPSQSMVAPTSLDSARHHVLQPAGLERMLHGCFLH